MILKPDRLLIFLSITLLIALPMPAARAAVVSGVEFADSFQGRGMKMGLIGCGVKRFLGIRFVGAALYMPEYAPVEQVLEKEIPKMLEVVYLVDLPKKELDRATIRGIKKNVSKDEFRRLEGKIDEVNSYWSDISKFDRITIAYYPETGMEIAINGEYRGTVVGADIAFAFYSIWVGERPVDDLTRETLLGIRPYNDKEEG